MDTVVLSGKKELDIYINPQRQKLMRCMRLAQTPQTPKQLADRMGISASAVQHHLKKLGELGLVEVSHTERIHGITASYYKLLPKTVSIGGPMGDLLHDEYAQQRLTLMQNSVSAVFEGFAQYCKHVDTTSPGSAQGDALSGIVYLRPQEAKELEGIVRAYLDAHETAAEHGEPWEYALIAYPAKEKTDA